MPWGTVRIRGDSKDRLEDLSDLLDESQGAIVSDLVDRRHREFFDENPGETHLRHNKERDDETDRISHDATRFRL